MLARHMLQKIAGTSGLHARFASSVPLVRDPSYGRVGNEDIKFFKGILGDTGVITDSTALQALNEYVAPSWLLHFGVICRLNVSRLHTMHLLADPKAPAAAHRDWMGKYEGKSTVALRPKSTEQVSNILAYCNDRRLAVVPQVSLFFKITARS